MRQAAAAVKTKVYDNRIVTFAPLYVSNLCVNDCVYCGFRGSNHAESRRILSQDEIRREIEVLAGQIGHKRLIVVYGEHPKSGIDYIAETLRTIMDVKVKTRRGWGQIRRCNVNAAPMSDRGASRPQRRGHRHVPGLPGDVSPGDLRAAASEATRSRATISGGCTACTGRWKPGSTTSGSGRCSACTTGSSRSWACCPTRSIWRSSSGSGRIRFRSRGSSRRTTRRSSRTSSTRSATRTSSGW